MKNKEKIIKFATYLYLAFFIIAYVTSLPYNESSITFIIKINDTILALDNFIRLKYGEKIAIIIFFIPHLIAILLFGIEIKSAYKKNQKIFLHIMIVFFVITIIATMLCLIFRLAFLGDGSFGNFRL